MVARVSFHNSSGCYDYLCGKGLSVGGYVAVPTGNHLSVAKVERVGRSSKAATKWVIQKVDMGAHKLRMRLLED